MLTVAAQRGDAIALIDHTNNLSKSVEDIYSDLNSLDDLKGLTSKEIEIGGDASKQEDARKYGAMFTPWATYESKVLSSAVILPASFAPEMNFLYWHLMPFSFAIFIAHSVISLG